MEYCRAYRLNEGCVYTLCKILRVTRADTLVPLLTPKWPTLEADHIQ